MFKSERAKPEKQIERKDQEEMKTEVKKKKPIYDFFETTDIELKCSIIFK